MTWSDIQYGEQQGARRERSARANDNNAWQDHSNKLEAKLNDAQRAELNEHVERKVAVDYVRALRKALSDLDPNHPLLRDDLAAKRFEEARTKAYGDRGYTHDAKSGLFSKKA